MGQQRKVAEGYWADCAASIPKVCAKSGRAGVVNVALSGKYAGLPICAGCARSLKVKRADSLPSDQVAQRLKMRGSDVLAAIPKGSWKGNYTRDGALKGGTPQVTPSALAQAYAKVGKGSVPKVRAPKVKRPAAKVTTTKVTKATGRKRPAAKSA